MNKSQLLYLLSAIFVLASSCGPEEEVVLSDITDSKSRPTCQFSYTEGGSIDLNATQFVSIKELSYGKRINISHINAVAHSSAKNTRS